MNARGLNRLVLMTIKDKINARISRRLLAISLVGLVITFLQPAMAATTTESPRYDACWGDNGTVGNSNGDLFGSPNIPGNCYKTINDFYDAFVDTINQYYPKPGDPRARLWVDYGWSDYGASYGATWVKTATFKKKAYHDGPLSSAGTLYNDCTEPDKPWNEVTHGYCGLERTDHYVWSCNTSSCMDWFGIPGNAVYDVVVKDFDMGGDITGLCLDGKLKTTTNAKGGQNPVGCANIIDRYFEKPKTCEPSGGNPIYPMTGAKKEAVPTGLSVGGQAFTLTYNTLRHLIAQADGLTSAAQLKDLPSFGALWSSNLHRRLNIKVGKVGIDAYRGDGLVVGFGLSAPLASGGTYVTSAGIDDTLTIIAGGYRYFDAAANLIETYNSVGQITSAADKNGNTLTFTYSAGAGTAAPAAGYLVNVADNVGRFISFTYTLPAGGNATSDGLISTVAAPGGNVIAATYDAANNLTTLTWPDSKSRSFLYENPALPWALTGKTDENGVRQATWAYDSAGRAISSDSALGTNHYGVTYDTPPQAVIIETYVVGNNLNYPDTIYRDHTWQIPIGLQLTNANGTTAAANVAMPNGYPVLAGISQAAGSGCSASNSASTFDAKGNLLSQDDFQGVRSCSAYDASNRETVRVDGLDNTVACTAVTSVGATLPSGARKISTAWHADWRLPTQISQPLRKTSTVYHGQPDSFNNNAVANCTTAVALPNGKPLPLVCKEVVQATLTDGTIDTSTVASVIGYTYDAVGRVLSSVDPNNRTTRYVYYSDTSFTGLDPNAIGHTVGDLQSITSPSGLVTTFDAYDKIGRILQTTDPKGVVIQMTYSPRGWVTAVTSTPPGLTARITTYTYDNAGQLVGVATPDGAGTTFSYDAAHRLIGITDAKGNRLNYTLDNMGNRIAEEVRDPTGNLQRSISRSFDALNRLQQVSGAAK